MPIYTIAEYRVRPVGVEKVRRAIEEFVPYVKANEPGTRLYAAWQKKDDPTQFVHFFIFERQGRGNLSEEIEKFLEDLRYRLTWVDQSHICASAMLPMPPAHS